MQRLSWLLVLQFWGKGFSPLSITEVPEPLYTKQPPRPGLNFREAVAEEAATRDFSMRFQVKSEAFQLCQETSPLSLSGCLLELGLQGHGLDTPTPPPSPDPSGGPTPCLAPSPQPLPAEAQGRDLEEEQRRV